MKSPKEILPQIVLDYVESVIHQMKYKRKVRQEVKDELLSHFEDALRGVDGQQERQKQAEELIREFGDIKILATLIRRGKKRCRPAWQKAIIRGFQAIGILFLLLILYIGWFFAGKPVITTNYLELMNQQVRPVADESQNAWPYYREAVAEYKEPVSQKSSSAYEEINQNNFDLSPQKLSNLDNTQRHTLDTWLADNQKAMELIQQGNQKPYYWQVYSTGESQKDGMPVMLEVLLPNMQKYKKLAQLLCWDAYRKAQEGNPKEAMSIALEVYNFGGHVRGQNTMLIQQLVGIAMESMACRTITEVLSDYKIDSAVLAEIQTNFEKLQEGKGSKISVKGEELFLDDELQRCFTQSCIGKSHLYLPRFHELGTASEDDFIYPKTGFRILFTHPDKEETQKALDRLFEIFDEIAKLSPAAADKRIQLNKQAKEMISKNLFLQVMFPAIGKVSETGYRNQMYGQATAALLAVSRYRLETGQYPVSLQELVQKGYLKEVPVDVYSDKPIVYKQKDDSFILYSLGPNLKDDGGQVCIYDDGKLDFWAKESGDIVFWPVYQEPAAK